MEAETKAPESREEVLERLRAMCLHIATSLGCLKAYSMSRSPSQMKYAQWSRVWKEFNELAALMLKVADVEDTDVTNQE